MEIVGATASLAALIGLTTTIAQGLYNMHYAVTKANKELQVIKDEIMVFSGILRGLQSSVNPLEEQKSEDVFCFAF